jgi:hypothetical protein
MKSTRYPNALLLRRQKHHVALYLWNMSPSRAPLPGRDYTCVPNLYSCAAFQDHPTFYSNLDVFPYPGECSRHGNVHLVEEAKTKYIKNNIPIAVTELANPIFLFFPMIFAAASSASRLFWRLKSFYHPVTHRPASIRKKGITYFINPAHWY